MDTDRKTQFLKNPGKYKSVSAFAPICNPINSQWGQKAFRGYLGGENKEKWSEHDATELIKHWKGGPLDILIDVVILVSQFLKHRPFKLIADLGNRR